MSLINCMGKLAAGKNGAALAFEDKAELHRAANEYMKKMPRVEAERAAVNDLLAEARENRDYIKQEAVNQLKLDEQVAKKVEPKKAEETPGNEPIETSAEEEQEPTVLGEREARKDTNIDAGTAIAHDMMDKYVGGKGHSIVDNVSHVLQKLVGSMESLHAIIDRVAPHMPSAKKWGAALGARDAMRGNIEQKYEVVSQQASRLSDASVRRVGDYLARSSIDKAWGHQPKDLGRTVEISPEWKAKFDALTPDEQNLVDTIFTINDGIGRVKQALLEDKGASGLFAARQLSEGPYVHLDRKGGYIAEFKSKKYMDAVKAKNKPLVAKLELNPKHHVVEAFDTPGEAKQRVRDKGKDYVFAFASEKISQPETQATMNPKVLDRIRSNLGVDPDTAPEVRDAMDKSIQSLYLSILDHNSAGQAERARKGTSGWVENVIGSVLKHGRAEAAYIANVAHGADINNSFAQMRHEIADPMTGHRVAATDYNLLNAHHMESLRYKETPFQDGVVWMTSAWQLVTSLSYHLANFSQTVMVMLPRLAADFGSGNYSKAWGHVVDGYKQMREITNDRGMTIDLSLVKDTNLREALQHAADLQLLDVGMTEDLKHFDRFSSGYKPIDATSNVAAKVVHKLRQVSSAVERWNRVSSATAAYNMAIEHGKTAAEAKDYVIDVLRTTQGDFSHSAAPLLLKKLPKVVGQYKKFQLMMGAYYVKAFMSSFRGATAEERAIGRRMLGFKLLHTGVASGVLGLPLMNLAGLVYQACGGAPDTLEDKLSTGDKTVDQLLQHGLPSLVGLDLSAKLGDENIFSIAPYSKLDLTSKTGVATTIAGVVGPWMGQAGRMAAGLGLIQQGDMYKGAEKLMPKGLEMAMQSFRIANDGYTMKNGDLLVKPEDISAFSVMLTAAGLPAAEVKQFQDQESKQYVVTKYFADKTKELEHAYTQAFKAKDQAEMVALRTKWMDLQKEKDAQRVHFKQTPDILKHQPLSTMLGAPQKVVQREQKHQREFGLN